MDLLLFCAQVTLTYLQMKNVLGKDQIYIYIETDTEHSVHPKVNKHTHTLTRITTK